MKKHFNSIFIIFSFSLITGCVSVPPGTAPEGEITTIKTVTDKELVSPKTAINTITTELIMSHFISGTKKVPTVILVPSLIDPSSEINSQYILKFNNLALNVYGRLLKSDLIKVPKNLTDFDYALVNISNQNPSFKNTEKGYKAFTWQLGLFSKDNKTTPCWSFTINVLIPELNVKKNQIKENEKVYN